MLCMALFCAEMKEKATVKEKKQKVAVKEKNEKAAAEKQVKAKIAEKRKANAGQKKIPGAPCRVC